MLAHETETRPVVLVVDDDPIMRKLVQRALAAIDCQEILEVEDGLAARELLEQRPVDLVITDVMMPGLDGLELIGWANEHCPDPVWIILSGIQSFDNAVQAIQLGAVDFLSKPPHAERLRLAVRNAWRHEQLLREHERLARALEQSHAELAERVGQLESKLTWSVMCIACQNDLWAPLMPARVDAFERRRSGWSPVGAG